MVLSEEERVRLRWLLTQQRAVLEEAARVAPRLGVNVNPLVILPKESNTTACQAQGQEAFTLDLPPQVYRPLDDGRGLASKGDGGGVGWVAGLRARGATLMLIGFGLGLNNDSLALCVASTNATF